MSLRPGQILKSRYRIVSLLSEGGFGTVYRAWDLNMEIPRALKENLDISPEAQSQFKRESQILDRITYPNLPKVIDHFVLEEVGQYLVMEFVEGEDLKEKMDKQGGPFLEEQVIPWIFQICDALSFLHRQNPPIIHRDIKPANIKITPKGLAVLVDFGIAKVYDPVLRTTIGARAVTPGYSPPEQYGQGRTDPRTDVYALGATLYTLLTSFSPPDSIDLLTGKEELPISIRDIKPPVSSRVEGVIKKAMQLNEGDRYGTIAEFKDALGEIEPIQVIRSHTDTTQETLSTRKLTKPEALTTTQKHKNRWIIGLISLIVIGLIVGLVSLGTNRLTMSESEPFVKMTQISPRDKAVMGYVPGGSFEMGSESGYENEQPVHQVSVPEFWIDQTEVTNKMYLSCVEAGVCRLPRDTEYIFDPALNHYPVNYVSWEDAQQYCEWVGRQLPSEAMWEKAARGGLVGKSFPWGNQNPVCTLGKSNGTQYADCGVTPAVVKSFQENGYGLFDMAGNLWEWVRDIYDSYPGGNPAADSDYDKGYHVVRGGSFYDQPSDIGNTIRLGFYHAERVDFIGFRCAFIP